MKFGVLNKSTVLNRFVLHTLQRNITRILKRGGGDWKRADIFKPLFVRLRIAIFDFPVQSWKFFEFLER